MRLKIVQVKPDNLAAFETFIVNVAETQKKHGCLDNKYVKRFFTIDGVEMGNHPRELTRIVKCVKYFSYWEDGNYAHAYVTCPHSDVRIFEIVLMMTMINGMVTAIS